MYQYTGKPKRDLQEAESAWERLRSFLVLAMPFEFAVNGPAQECARRLWDAEEGGFFKAQFETTTRVNIALTDATTYEFSIKRSPPRQVSPATVRGLLIGISEDETLIRGTVETVNLTLFLIGLVITSVVWAYVITIPVAILVLVGTIYWSIRLFRREERNLITFVGDTVAYGNGLGKKYARTNVRSG